MNVVRIKTIAGAAFFVLAACATLSEDGCLEGNWTQIGLRDGANGRSADFIDQHAKACSKFEISVNRSAWEAGRQQGLKTYCTRPNAYREGASGRQLRDVCAIELQEALQVANERGLIWYDIGQDIADAQREIRSISGQLATLAAGDPARSGLISQRAHLRLQILNLRARRIRFS